MPTGIPLNPKPRIERFMAKVHVEGECWIWTGALTVANARTEGGYGLFWDGERQVLAHRWSYEYHIGPIPAGMQLDHISCSRRGCVRPDHLTPATNRANALRGDSPMARAVRSGRCKRGHPLEGANVRQSGGRGRECRACKQIRARESWRASHPDARPPKPVVLAT